jgi:hypothetical protein
VLNKPSVVRAALKAVTPVALRPRACADRQLARLRRGNRIMAGPFREMYFSWADWDPHFTVPLAKFLGTYEMELHPVIEKLIRTPPERFVDVGAADGFYAIGFALRCPSTRVLAFEQLDKGRELIQELAARNGVAERVDIRGRCDLVTLRQALEAPGRTLVMMDVEGAESQLLDSTGVPALERSTILVETHDCYVPGVTGILRERFETTHRIHAIESRGRQASDAPVIRSWLRVYAKYNVGGWMGERLHPVTWLLLEPLATSGTA